MKMVRTRTIRVLVVDDYVPFLQFLRSTLGKWADLQVISEVSDGLSAVQKAQELRPDLILLDIGLPTLNGIDAAKRILELSPDSKILFISQETSSEIVMGALATGAKGYVVKTDARNELLTALETILRGQRYISTALAECDFPTVSNAGATQGVSNGTFRTAGFPIHPAREQGHVVQFYTDHAVLLDGLSQVFGDSLDAGGSVVAVMTRPHRSGLEDRLIAKGIDLSDAMKNGRLTIFDADQALSEFMDAVGPSRERFLLLFGNIVRKAGAAAVAKNSRVFVFGEMVAVLWARRAYDAVIRLEELWNELSLTCSFYLCCAYPASGFRGKLKSEPYARICAQHSGVVSAF
jgi:DNA-binding response OmpR family regulator